MSIERGDKNYFVDWVRAVTADIDKLSIEGKIRVRCMADLYRAMVNENNDGEARLAMTLVLAELSHTHPVQKMARFPDCLGCEAEIAAAALDETDR